jgi:DHA1 family bicyclomycin/chloramphenicol resistance-like MFS transporter
VLVAFGIGSAITVSRLLPETLRQRAPEPVSPASMLRAYATFVRHGGFVANLLIVAASFAGLYAWISAASFVMQNLYGLSPIGFGIAFAVGSIGYMLGTFVAARIVPRLGLDRTIGIGAAALAFGGIAALVPLAFGIHSATALVVPVSIYLAGMGLAMPQAMAGALSPFPDRAGTASSLLGFIQQTCAAVLGALVGRLLDHSAWPLAIALAVMGCAVLAIWATTRKVRQRDLARH